MNQGTKLVLLKKKNRIQKSRASVPLKEQSMKDMYIVEQYCPRTLCSSCGSALALRKGNPGGVAIQCDQLRASSLVN